MVSMRIRIRIQIKIFSSMLGSQTIADPCVHIQLERAGETVTKMLKTVVWIRIGFNADPDTNPD